ncbi:MAG: hypothetical protein IJR50_08515 [Treponema sp.]|nr:hypothetical protein [Treponema sp.]
MEIEQFQNTLFWVEKNPPIKTIISQNALSSRATAREQAAEGRLFKAFAP